jgi:alpha-tubulin suppressor-like RCC1 family protein
MNIAKLISIAAVAACSAIGLAVPSPACGDSIVAWGNSELGQCDMPAPNTNFVAVGASRDHSLGLKADRSIWVWGANYHGQASA